MFYIFSAVKTLCVALGCKNGWKEDTTHNKCMKVFKEDANKMTWTNALRKCEEQGLNGTLASLLVDFKVEGRLKFIFICTQSCKNTYFLGPSGAQ